MGSRKRIASLLLSACFAAFGTNLCEGQIVQLPTSSTFSISTAVAVPDSGSASLGGGQSSISGYSRSGSQSAMGGRTSGGMASVHATIIDLDELDKMIRSQASQTPIKLDLSKSKSRPARSPAPSLAKPASPPAYDYMIAMSHSSTEQARAFDDARYYLTLAADAKQRGHWSSVELYYQLAWNSLPEGRKYSALRMLMESREKTTAETARSSGASNANQSDVVSR